MGDTLIWCWLRFGRFYDFSRQSHVSRKCCHPSPPSPHPDMSSKGWRDTGPIQLALARLIRRGGGQVQPSGQIFPSSARGRLRKQSSVPNRYNSSALRRGWLLFGAGESAKKEAPAGGMLAAHAHQPADHKTFFTGPLGWGRIGWD